MPDMYAFQASKPTPESKTDVSTPHITPNILPCRIHHDGPIESPARFWTPVTTDETDHTQTAHFRGRKLRGRRVGVPEGYQGVIATPTDQVMPPTLRADNPSPAEDGNSEPDEVKVLEVRGEFDSVMVWGHEILPAADDTFVKGVEEWVRFAETMHSASTLAAPSDKQ